MHRLRYRLDIHASIYKEIEFSSGLRGVKFRRGSPFIIFRAVISPRATRNHLLNGSIPPSPPPSSAFQRVIRFQKRNFSGFESLEKKLAIYISLHFSRVMRDFERWPILLSAISFFKDWRGKRISNRPRKGIVIEILNFALSHHSNRSNLFSKIFIILDCFFYLKLELFFRVNPSLAILRMEILFLKFRKHY